MSHPENPSPAPRFRLGDQVRVRYGVTDPDFLDIPLGGWAGTITDVEQSEDEEDEFAYEVEWNPRTLRDMHPIYKNRCERDGFEVEIMWLSDDELEPDDGTLVPIEPATAIKTPPLSEDDEEDRVRMAFGLTHDDLLPDVNPETLLTYHRYLAARLKFPIALASSWESTGPFSSKRKTVTMTGLVDLEDQSPDEEVGLICTGRDQGKVIEVPLDAIELKKKDPNDQLISDYSYWFHNYR